MAVIGYTYFLYFFKSAVSFVIFDYTGVECSDGAAEVQKKTNEFCGIKRGSAEYDRTHKIECFICQSTPQNTNFFKKLVT